MCARQDEPILRLITSSSTLRSNQIPTRAPRVRELNFKDLTISQRRVETKATREWKSKRAKNDEEVLSRFARKTILVLELYSNNLALSRPWESKWENRNPIRNVAQRWGTKTINWFNSCRALPQIPNLDVSRILHAVIFVTLMTSTFFTRDRDASRARRISHGSLVRNRDHAARVCDPIRIFPRKRSSSRSSLRKQR